MSMIGRDEYGKLVVQSKGSDDPSSWDLFYDGIKIATCDDKPNTPYDPNRSVQVDLSGIMNQPHLQRLKNYQRILLDRKGLFERIFRKGQHIELFYDSRTLDLYFHNIINTIQADVESIIFDIDYEKDKNFFKNIPFTASFKYSRANLNRFEYLVSVIDWLITDLNGKEESNESFSNDSQHNLKQLADTTNDISEKEDPKAVVDDPDDLRNKLVELRKDCFIVNKSGQYEVPKRKAQKFIDMCFEYNYLVEKDDSGDDCFGVQWLYDHVIINTTLKNLKVYISRHKQSKN